MEKVLTDFPILPYTDPTTTACDPKPILPIHYYDNDDGFWTEYIQHKQDKWASNDMIVNRMFLKH
jgi:hypothetical protein